MIRGIVVFGANGSGKTTLGCELAQAINFKHIDVEDYYFEKSDIFYENPRTKDDVIHLMLTDIEKYGSFVLSGVTGIDKYSELALPNGDIYENTKKFIEYARKRDLSVINQWANTLTCPIIHLDTTMPIFHNTRKIIDAYFTIDGGKDAKST